MTLWLTVTLRTLEESHFWCIAENAGATETNKCNVQDIPSWMKPVFLQSYILTVRGWLLEFTIFAHHAVQTLSESAPSCLRSSCCRLRLEAQCVLVILGKSSHRFKRKYI